MNEMRVASIAFAAYLHSSALAQSITMIGAPVRVNGAYSSRITSAPRGSSAPMTTRSGLRKSSTAAPCFRNSGLLTTLNGCVVSRRIDLAHLLGGADRHGALVDDDLVAVHRPGDVAGDAEHVLQVGRAVLGLGRADGDEDDLSDARTARGSVGRERQALLGRVALDQLLEARLVDRDLAPSAGHATLAASLSTQTTCCRSRRSRPRRPGRRSPFPPLRSS